MLRNLLVGALRAQLDTMNTALDLVHMPILLAGSALEFATDLLEDLA